MEYKLDTANYRTKDIGCPKCYGAGYYSNANSDHVYCYYCKGLGEVRIIDK